MAHKHFQKLDYYAINGSSEVRYLGEAVFGVGDDDLRWTIKRMSHVQALDGTNVVSQIQTLSGVSWTSRDSLPWQ